MGKMNVAQFATELCLPVELLLEQLQASGVSKKQETDPVSEEDKAILLAHLRSAHGINAGKITLTRRETTPIRKTDSSGKARTIMLEVQVCKPRILAQTAVTGAEVPLKQRAANKEIVTPVNHKRQMEVDRCFLKAKELLPEHPAESLNNMRKACEAICKDILDETSEKKDEGKSLKPASAFTSLEDMIQELKRRKLVPIAIEKFLSSLQSFGNIGSHHHDNLSEMDVSIMAESVLPQLKVVVDWYKTLDLSAGILLSPLSR